LGGRGRGVAVLRRKGRRNHEKAYAIVGNGKATSRGPTNGKDFKSGESVRGEERGKGERLCGLSVVGGQRGGGGKGAKGGDKKKRG